MNDLTRTGKSLVKANPKTALMVGLATVVVAVVLLDWLLVPLLLLAAGFWVWQNAR